MCCRLEREADAATRESACAVLGEIVDCHASFSLARWREGDDVVGVRQFTRFGSRRIDNIDVTRKAGVVFSKCNGVRVAVVGDVVSGDHGSLEGRFWKGGGGRGGGGC